MYTEFVEPPNPFFLVGTDYARINIELYKLFAYKIRMFNWIVLPDFIVGKILFTLGYYGDFDITPYHPQKVFNKFLEVLDNGIPKPYFAWLHLYPPHFPYLSPPPYMGMFEPSDKYRTYKAQNEAKRSKASDASTILRGRYDELIRYGDRQLEEFIQELEARGELENTVIIVSSDHGESFERGKVITHGTSLYEESTHIPLIIKEPGQKEGRVIRDRVSQVDISATILGLSHISLPDWMEGRSLLPLMRDKTLPDIPVFSMDLQKNPSRGQEITKGIIAVWDGDYKLIHSLEKGKSLLFNLKNDPDELNNIFNDEPEVGQRLLTIIQDNLELANKRIIRRKK
jgi:arylsulfatase A-like enzyme